MPTGSLRQRVQPRALRAIEILAEMGLSAKQVWDRFGISRSSLNNWRLKGVELSDATCDALASKLGVSPTWLKTGAGTRQPASDGSGPTQHVARGPRVGQRRVVAMIPTSVPGQSVVIDDEGKLLGLLSEASMDGLPEDR